MARIEIDKMSKLLQVYFIMGSNNCTRDPLAVLKEALDGGVTIFSVSREGGRFFNRRR